MDKEEITKHCLDLNKRVNDIEDYMEKYAKYKKGFDVKEFQLTESHVANLYEQIQKLNKNLDEQIEINNRNKIIIESQNRSITNLKNENLLLKSQLEGKELKDKITYPFLGNPLKDNINLTSQNNFNTKTKSTNNYIYTGTYENSKYNDIYRLSNPNTNDRLNTTNNIKSTVNQVTNTKGINVFNQGNKFKRPASSSSKSSFRKSKI